MKGKVFGIICCICCICYTVPSLADVAVNEVIFPDNIFREYVSTNFDTDGDGILTDFEISNVVSIDVKNKKITNLQGIEYFLFLKWLDCSSTAHSSSKNEIEILDLSNNLELEYLDCASYIYLKELDIKNCRKLKYLRCGGIYGSGNYIEKLDLSNFILLSYLDISYLHRLKELDVSKNKKLETLICCEVPLEKLDLTNNIALKKLNCSGYFGEHWSYETGIEFRFGSLRTLDLSKNIELTELICSYNSNLTDLDLTNNKKLEILDCCWCNLSKLNIGKNVELLKLNCNFNNLSELNIEQNTSLTYLDCRNSKMIGLLDISKLTALEYFSYYGSVKNLQNNVALKYLNCSGDIDVSKNIALYELHCRGKNLKDLNLSNNKELHNLYLENSGLTSLNISNLKKLNMVTISNNSDLNSINASGSFNDLNILDYIECENNINLISCDFSGSMVDSIRFLKCRIRELNLKDWKPQDQLFLCSENELTFLEVPYLGYYSNVKNQKRSELKFETTGDINYPYKFDFREVIPETKLGCIAAETIKVYDKDNNEVEYQYSNGILWLKTEPTEIDYYSKVFLLNTETYSDTKSMDVSLLFYGKPEFITPEQLPVGKVGQEYIAEIKAISGFKYTFTGILPSGLSFDVKSGVISGIPFEACNIDFIVTVENKLGFSKKHFNLIIKSAPIISTNKIASGEVDSWYQMKFELSAGKNVTWTIKGDLPKGLSFNSSTGTLSGTPSEIWNKNIIIIATNSEGSDSKEFQLIIIGKKPTISTKTLKNGEVGLKYTDIMKANGTTPINWEKYSGNLPDGLSLNSSTGEITGTPSKSGTYSFSIRAKNDAGYSESKSFSITINEKPTITTSEGALINGVVGNSYSYTLEASGTNPITWEKYSGNLPKGLALNSSNGKITGTPSKSGTYSFSIRAKNIVGYSENKNFTITINEKPVIQTWTLNHAEIGNYYSETLKATGTTPITWEIVKEKLPNGLSLNTQTGEISGIPTNVKEGVYVFDIRAKNIAGYSDETRTLFIVIKQAKEKPVITTTTLMSGIVGNSYSYTLEASGTNPITWELKTGNLPNGLSLNASTGIISGIPKKAGTYNFSIRAKNDAGYSEPKNFSITINEKSSIITKEGALTNGTVGISYNYTFKVSGTKPITLEIYNETLPPGLSLDSSCSITGTPTKTGIYNFSIRAKNDAGYSEAKNFTIDINEKPIITTSEGALTNGKVGDFYSYELSASGIPTKWERKTGNFPSGLSINSSGIISGIPKKAGTYNFSIQAKNSVGYSEPKNFSITITDSKPIITTSEIPAGEIGVNYNFQLQTESEFDVTWIKSGSFPKGLQMSNSGLITGLPIKNGNYKITVKAKNKSGTNSKTFTLSITGENPVKPKITTSKLPNGTNGHLYTASIEATGSNPITWDLISNNFPEDSNFKFDETSGTITVTPTKAGNFSLKVKATNLLGSVTKSLKITVKEEIPVITTSELPDGTVKDNYDFDLEASGTGKIQWSKSGNFPKGLKLTNTGKISGIPTKAGTYKFKIKAKNSAGTATSDFQIVIVDNKDNKSDFKKGSEKSLLEENISLINSKKIDNDNSEIEQSNSGNQPKLTKLFVLSDDEFVEVQECAVQPNQAITFKVGNWVNSNGETIEVSDIKLRVITDESEFLDTPEISDEGIFVVPEELVEGELIISLKALSGDINIESESVLVNSDE